MPQITKFPFAGLGATKIVHKKDTKIKLLISKIPFYTFVGNVYAHLGLATFSYWTCFDASRPDFRSKKLPFFSKYDFFDFSINRPIWPILMI